MKTIAMDRKLHSSNRRWWLDIPLVCHTEFHLCLRRIFSWHTPPNWCATDWFEEICAVAATAACDAECCFDPAYGVALDAYVHSRVLSRALTRYRQEWAFSNRNVFDIVEERDEDTRRLGGAFLLPVIEANPACDALLEEMTDLSSQSRWLIKQLFWEDRTEAEIGRELGISQQAVAKRKRSVLRILRERLKKPQRILSSEVVKVAAQHNPLLRTKTRGKVLE